MSWCCGFILKIWLHFNVFFLWILNLFGRSISSLLNLINITFTSPSIRPPVLTQKIIYINHLKKSLLNKRKTKNTKLMWHKRRHKVMWAEREGEPRSERIFQNNHHLHDIVAVCLSCKQISIKKKYLQINVICRTFFLFLFLMLENWILNYFFEWFLRVIEGWGD